MTGHHISKASRPMGLLFNYCEFKINYVGVNCDTHKKSVTDLHNTNIVDRERNYLVTILLLTKLHVLCFKLDALDKESVRIKDREKVEGLIREFINGGRQKLQVT